MKAAKIIFRMLTTVASLIWISIFLLASNALVAIMGSLLVLALYPLLCLEIRRLANHLMPPNAEYLDKLYTFWLWKDAVYLGIMLIFTALIRSTDWEPAIFSLSAIGWIFLCRDFWLLLFEARLLPEKAKWPKVVVTFLPVERLYVLRYSWSQYLDSEGNPTTLSNAMTQGGLGAQAQIAKKAIKLGYHPIPETSPNRDFA